MPIIQVYLKKNTSQEYRASIAKGIKQAMIHVLGLPEDDYNQITTEKEAEDMIYDPKFFGIPRSEKMVFIGLTFNTGRPPETKKALFEKIAGNLVSDPGIRIEDIMMNIIECPQENWWAFARTINAETGLDSRMTAGIEGVRGAVAE